jgi:hypothetical protein
MAIVKKGMLKASSEWAKHLRKYKGRFWKQHRKSETREIRSEATAHKNNPSA